MSRHTRTGNARSCSICFAPSDIPRQQGDYMIYRVMRAFILVVACAGLVTVGLPTGEAAAAQPADTSTCSGVHPVDTGIVMQECINISNTIGSAETIIIWETGTEPVGAVTAQVTRDGHAGPLKDCGTLREPASGVATCTAGANQESGTQSWVACGTWSTNSSIHGRVCSPKVGG
jgi:hypothetical protein